MFPDAFDITSLEDFTSLNGFLASSAGFLGNPDITSAFLVDPDGITVGEYLGIIDTAEQNLLATDFSFLQGVIPQVRTQLEQSISADTLPDGVTVEDAVDQSVSVLQSFADGDTSFVTDGFDTIRSLLDGVPEDTLLVDAFQLDVPDVDLPDTIEDFIGGLPAFSFDTPPAWVSGDPHLRTLDGANYDFQAAGEFVLLRSTDGQGFELQSRMVPAGENVSVNQAIATNVDGTPVMIDSADPQPLHVDGNVVILEDGGALDVGTGRIYRQGDSYTIVYPGADGEVGDGDSQVVVRVRDGRLDLDVRLNAELLGALQGLLGDGDGTPDNDIARADGTVLAQPLVFEELYGGFRDDWRVDRLGQSLFTYDADESPDGFYQADFPAEIVSLDTLDPELRASARQAALDAGLQEDSESFENAVLDFALTNDAGFLASALDVPVSDLGTEQADLLTGNSGDDVLEGLGGDDSVFGRAGNDVLRGGDGGDNIGGGDGNDQVNGDADNDNLGGGLGTDTMDGGAGNDFMGGGLGNDAMDGGAGNDVVNGGAGDDTLEGGSGNDTMGASFGDDEVSGGDGDDDMGGGAGQDTVDAGAGDDSVGGGEGDDVIDGGEGDDFLAGGGRNDDITGGAGDDSINGGDGDDTMEGGDGADVFVFNFFKDGDADVITDYEDGTDSFLIRTTNPDTGETNIENGGLGLQGFVNALNITDTVDGAQMNIGGHLVLVEGVAAADLTADDFLFL